MLNPTNNMSLMVNTFLGQVANPECSYLTGMIIGAAGVSRITITFFLVLIIYKAIDKLAIEPFLSWIKSRIYKKRENEKLSGGG